MCELLFNQYEGCQKLLHKGNKENKIRKEGKKKKRYTLMSFERIPLLVIGISHQYLFYIVISSIEGTEKQIIL